MPKINEKPPKVTLPPCGGCDVCGSAEPFDPRLYILHGKAWYCKRCFREGPGRSWPKIKIEVKQSEEKDELGNERQWEIEDVFDGSYEGYEPAEA